MGRLTAGIDVRRALTSSADRVLVHWGEQEWTGVELDSAVERLAARLQSTSPPAGRVGLWYWNSVWALVAHLAVERAGLTRVPVDPGAPLDEARAIWEAADVDVVLADTPHAVGLGSAIIFDETADLPAGVASPVEVDDDLTHLLFPRTVSSGGLLAIPISYRGWAAHMATNTRLFRGGGYGPPVDDGDLLMTVQQMMHGTGLVATFPFLLMEMRQVILEKFDASTVAEAALEHRATSAFMVPGMVTRLAEWVEQNEPLPLRRIVYGGAPITPEELRHALTHLGPVLTQIYGRLEGGWPLTVLGAEDHRGIAGGDVRLLDSCGQMIAEVELETRPLVGVTGQVGGELRVRGAMCSPPSSTPTAGARWGISRPSQRMAMCGSTDASTG